MQKRPFLSIHGAGPPVAIVALIAGIVAYSLGCIRFEREKHSHVSAPQDESAVESTTNVTANNVEVGVPSPTKPGTAAQPQEADDIHLRQADGDKIRLALADNVADFWIYEDVEAGFVESQRTGKPLLLSIR